MRVVAEVDVDLGLTRVVWIGAAQEVGRAIDPRSVEGQIEGGIAQGLGLALMEEIQTRDGLITNASFTDYLIPTALDMPPVDTVIIEDPDPDAPYGVKGVGEPPTVVSTAAVVAALRDATRPRAPARSGHARRARRRLANLSSGTAAEGGSCRTTIATEPDDDRGADSHPHRHRLVAEQHAEQDRDDRVHVRVGRDEARAAPWRAARCTP